MVRACSLTLVEWFDSTDGIIGSFSLQYCTGSSTASTHDAGTCLVCKHEGTFPSGLTKQWKTASASEREELRASLAAAVLAHCTAVDTRMTAWCTAHGVALPSVALDDGAPSFEVMKVNTYQAKKRLTVVLAYTYTKDSGDVVKKEHVWKYGHTTPLTEVLKTLTDSTPITNCAGHVTGGYLFFDGGIQFVQASGTIDDYCLADGVKLDALCKVVISWIEDDDNHTGSNKGLRKKLDKLASVSAALHATKYDGLHVTAKFKNKKLASMHIYLQFLRSKASESGGKVKNTGKGRKLKTMTYTTFEGKTVECMFMGEWSC